MSPQKLKKYLYFLVTLIWAVICLGTCLLFTGLRLHNQLLEPLPSLTLVLFASILASCGIMARYIWSHFPVRIKMTLNLTQTVLFGITGLAIHLPGTDLFASVLFWILLMVDSMAGILIFIPTSVSTVRNSSEKNTPDSEILSHSPVTSSPQENIIPVPSYIPSEIFTESGCEHEISDISEDEENAEDLIPQPEQCVSQTFTRRTNSELHECIEGFLRADFLTGQHTSVLYIGFCPPLRTTPDVTCMPVEEGVADTVLQDVSPVGVRISVTRSITTLADHFFLKFYAQEN